MLMFVSGEGGTGEFFLISWSMEFAQLHHGKQLGVYGSTLAVVPTGAAANIINGFTWQSVCNKGKFSFRADKANDTYIMSDPTAKAVG